MLNNCRVVLHKVLGVCGSHTHNRIPTCVDDIHSYNHGICLDQLLRQTHSVEIKAALGIDLSKQIGNNTHDSNLLLDVLQEHELADYSHLVQVFLDEWMVSFSAYQNEADLHFFPLQIVVKAIDEVATVSSVLASILLQSSVIWHLDPNRFTFELHAKRA